MKLIDAVINKSKLRLLEMHKEANAGHIGGNLSCLDILIILHHLVIKPNDRFILSKGHSAGALYVTLWSMGKLSDGDLETFCQDNSFLAAHPCGGEIPGLLFSTGSLGHGASLASGLALAAKYKKNNRHIYCLCSDGEWQEGSCWEALIFAIHQQLDNLTIIIDQNGLQGFGTTEEVISCNDIAPRIKSFGAEVISIDGHDSVEIKRGLESNVSGKPKVLIINTIKGRGLHFENLMESHYLPLSEDQYQSACKDIKMDMK